MLWTIVINIEYYVVYIKYILVSTYIVLVVHQSDTSSVIYLILMQCNRNINYSKHLIINIIYIV